MTSTFSTSDGAKLELDLIEGTVLSVEDREHVVVNQGSSTMRYNHALDQTFSEPGGIYSEVIKTNKVWIKQDNGKDRQVDISDVPIALMAGHRLTVYLVSKAHSEDGYYWAAKNMNTDEVSWRDLSEGISLADNLGISNPQFLKNLLIKPVKKALIIGAVAGTICYLLSPKVTIGFAFNCFLLFGICSAFLFIVFGLLKNRKDHLKPLAEVTAQVKQAFN